MSTLPFHPPRLRDISSLQNFFKHGLSDWRGNDLNYANLFLLQGQYSTQIAYESQVLYRHYDDNARFCGYGFPLSKDKKEVHDALNRIEYDAIERGRKVNYCLMSKEQCELLKQLRPKQYIFSKHREDTDYIYSCESLSQFKGASLRKKRNRLMRFLRYLEENSSTWNIESIQRGHFFDILRIAQAWQDEQREQGALLSKPTILGQARHGEFASLRKALRYWRELGLFGIILRIDGQACGFSVASHSSSELVDVHYEKCHPDYRDAYPLLVNSLAQSIKAIYINREEDLGIEGLRRSKLSYHPAILLDKYAGFHVGQGRGLTPPVPE